MTGTRKGIPRLLPKIATGIQELDEITSVASCPRGVLTRLRHCGVSLLPITSLQLDREASATRVTPDIARLGEKLGAKRALGGSRVLVSGSPCTGKSNIAFGNRLQRIGAPRPRVGRSGVCALRISK